jgi:uncharacterized membrane protein YdcZ (DUF606 family)
MEARIGAVALAVDHSGLMGMPKNTISVTRVASRTLVAVGVALIPP